MANYLNKFALKEKRKERIFLNSSQHDKNWAGSDAEGLFKQIFTDALEL